MDTGADVSAVSESFYNSLPSKIILSRNYNRDTLMQCASASGTDFENLGEVELEFRIDSVPYKHNFQVLKGLSKPVIIGSDFLGKHNAIVDFYQQSIRIGQHMFKMGKSISELDGIHLLHTTQRVTLSPNKVTVFPCKMPQNAPLGSYLARFLDNTELSGQPGISIANTLVAVDGSRVISLMAVNETGAKHIIPCRAVVGLLEPIEAQEVNEISVTPSDDREKLAQPQAVALTLEQAEHFNALLDHYSCIFAESDLELGCANRVKCTIDTGNAAPIKQRPYRTPFLQRPLVEDHLAKMMSVDIIRPSTSPWASPIVIVDKKDKSKRFCVDFRKVNFLTVPNSYPLPQIDDILASLGGAKYFSKMDLKSGYWQIQMDDESRPKTAFITHMGLFEFNKMPFGLCNAPSIFQDLMNNVLQGLLFKFALAYLDDIIVYSRSFEEHLEHLDQVFERLLQADLKLKLSKCEFFMQQLQFLGHMVSANGIQPDFDKVKAICNMPPPKCVKDIRAFIGMCGYYRRYIPNFAHVAGPLISLTRKNAVFTWSPACEQAFQTLKTWLTNSPVLIHPDLNKPYRVYTDASDYAVGAILAQLGDDGEKHVVHYLSQQLSRTQRKWATIEKEAWAVVTALKKFRQYLLGAEFTIFTDHKPLKSLFTAEMKNARIQRWGILISEFNCSIQYREGKHMKADFVSRIRGPIEGQVASTPPDNCDDSVALVGHNSSFPPATGHDEPVACAALCGVDSPAVGGHSCAHDGLPAPGHIDGSEVGALPEDVTALRKLQQADPEIGDIFDSVKRGDTGGKCADYVMEDGVLYRVAKPVRWDNLHHLQLVVPRLLIPGILFMMHDRHGHMGVDKTHDLIRQRYFWSNSYRDVQGYVNKCLPCAQRKLRALRVPIQSMPIPNAPFQMVAMDLQGPLSRDWGWWPLHSILGLYVLGVARGLSHSQQTGWHCGPRTVGRIHTPPFMPRDTS